MFNLQFYIRAAVRLRHGLCSLFLLAITCSTHSEADDVGIPSEIKDSLYHNSAALSPITVKFTKQVSSSVPISEWLEKVNYPPYSVDTFLPAEVEFCWQDGMAYQYIMGKKANLIGVMDISDPNNPRLKKGAKLDDLPLVSDESERASNLQEFFSGHGRTTSASSASNPSLMIDQIQSPRLFSPSDHALNPDYFYRTGFIMPRRFDELRNAIKPRILSLIDQGADVEGVEQIELGDAECVVVELSTAHQLMRFYLDASLGYALRRSEELNRSGQKQIVVEMSDFVRLSSPEVWMPKYCEVIYYTWHTVPELITEVPLARESFVVHTIEKRPIPVEKFSLHYTMPGTLVSDSTLSGPESRPGGIVSYEVPADSRLLDATIQRAMGGKPLGPFGLTGWGRIPGLLVFVTAMALAVLVGWVVTRRIPGQRS